MTGAIQQAIATQDWNRALSQATAASAKFSTDEIARLKRQAELGKQQKEIEESEAGILNARKAGNLDLAAELATAARIRWPQENRFLKLENEIQEARAEQKVVEARKLVAAKKLDDAEKLARQALKRCPNLLSASDVLADIAARRQAIDQLKSREDSSKNIQPVAPSSPDRKKLIFLLAAFGILIGLLIVWKLLPSKKTTIDQAGATATDTATPSPSNPPANPPSNPAANPPVPSTTPTEVKVSDTLDYPKLEQGQDYNDILHASGGTSLTWSLGAGRLPRGLTMDKNGRIQGRTTDRPAIYSFEAVATDASGVTGSAKLNLTVVATAAANAGGGKPQPVAPGPEKKAAEQVVPPPPQPKEQPPAVQACKTFNLATYGDLKKGKFNWSGRLTNGQATIPWNTVHGDYPPPGTPATYTVVSPAGATVSGPDKANCWNAPLVVHTTSGDAAIQVTIAFQVFQP